MNFDRNTVIGFVVLAALFFGYFFYTNQEQATYRKEQARIDSIANAGKPKPDTLSQKIDSVKADSIGRVTNAGNYQSAANGIEQLTEVNSDLFKIVFTRIIAIVTRIIKIRYRKPSPMNFVQEIL